MMFLNAKSKIHTILEESYYIKMILENRLVVDKGERVGWIGSLGLIDANYCLWNELAMRSCCLALGTMSGHLWWNMIMWEKRMYTCMCHWVTLLYSRKLTEHCKLSIMANIKIIIKIFLKRILILSCVYCFISCITCIMLLILFKN